MPRSAAPVWLRRLSAIAYRRKAKQNLKAAESLIVISCRDAAANRLYYALFHGVVGELEAKGIHPSELAGWHSPDDSWHHDTVMNNARRLAGLTRRELQLCKIIKGLRVRADYRPEPVLDVDLDHHPAAVRDLLEGLGAL